MKIKLMLFLLLAVAGGCSKFESGDRIRFIYNKNVEATVLSPSGPSDTRALIDYPESNTRIKVKIHEDDWEKID